MSTNLLVLCGSYFGYKDEQVLLEVFGGKYVDLKILPPKTTKYTQRLEVYFFIQYKIYAKRITHFIKVLRSSNMQPKFHDRFFIMKLNSIIYNQLSAETYRPMLRYAWQNVGYDISEPVNNFTSVIDVAWYYRMCSNDMWSLWFSSLCVLYHSYCFEHFIESPHLHLDIYLYCVWLL